MKVTTELKNYIKDEFEKKRTNLLKLYTEERKLCYESVIEKVREDEDYKKLVEVAKTFYDKYSELIVSETSYSNPEPTYRTSTFSNLKNLGAKNLIGFNTSTNYDKLYKEELALINSQERTLMLNLQYQKDLGSIVELLAYYGIAI